MQKKRITVSQGILEGEETESYAVYKGIPYAEPPVGNLRFRAPQPEKKWEGIRNATEFSSRCYQMDQQKGFYGKEFYSNKDFLPAMNEDCLYLNIWTPKEQSEEEKGYPVAFWIHGGGFVNGFGSELEFDGENFAKAGIILVTINYRLGALGFLALPELAQEDAHGSTGNYGILDQLMALQWVNDNISSFGGNPKNITIFGQSAGAMSVQAIVNSPLGKGLFQKVIMQSGGGVNNGLVKDISREKACLLGEKMKKICKVKTVEELRQLPADIFGKQSLRLMIAAKGLPYSPVQDGYVLTSNFDENVKGGRVADVPYILGSNSDDLDIKNKKKKPHGGIYRGCIDWALARESSSVQPTYVYFFSRQMPGDKAGAFHSSELWYMFGTLHRCWRPLEQHDYDLSSEMISSWASFIKTGEPVDWEPYTKENPYIKEFK